MSSLALSPWTRVCVTSLKVWCSYEIGETAKVPGANVTFVDANHCPGAAMLLFEVRFRGQTHRNPKLPPAKHLAVTPSLHPTFRPTCTHTSARTRSLTSDRTRTFSRAQLGDTMQVLLHCGDMRYDTRMEVATGVL